MGKLKSSLLNMFLSLTGICIVAAAILAFFNDVTEQPIQDARKDKLEKSIGQVIPGFDNSPLEEAYKIPLGEGDSLIAYPAKKGNQWIGTAIESNTKNGFSGEIKILVGISAKGELIDFAVLKHAETPGLGDKIDPWFKTNEKNQNILGKDLSAGDLLLRKDGGNVDAITAATITSRAFLEAVNKAYAAYSGQDWDSSTGATGGVEY